MAVPITIPRLGWTMDEGLFAGWTKKDGDPVHPGEAIFNLETDKALQEVECLDAGVLRISPAAPKAGDKVAVGTVIGYIVAPGEAIPTDPAAPPPPAAERPVPAAAERRAPEPERSGPAISPRAARLASELGVDWSRLKGSGRGGRITEEDVRAAAPSPA